VPLVLTMALIGFVVGIGCELLPLPISPSGALALPFTTVLLILYPWIGLKQDPAMATSDLHGFAPKQE